MFEFPCLFQSRIWYFLHTFSIIQHNYDKFLFSETRNYNHHLLGLPFRLYYQINQNSKCPIEPNPIYEQLCIVRREKKKNKNTKLNTIPQMKELMDRYRIALEFFSKFLLKNRDG